MSTESDTPETDAAMEFIHDRGMTEWTPADLARKLERQRDQYRTALEDIAGSMLTSRDTADFAASALRAGRGAE